MSITVVNHAISIAQSQTKRLRKFLKKNRNRIVYCVQNDNGLNRHIYSFYKAVILAAHHGAWIYQGEQNARWIKAGRLSGIKWNRCRTWYMPKILDK